MNFRHFRFRQFLPYLLTALIYPLVTLLTAEKKLLKCTDALTITGFVFLILGVASSLVRRGDFDITEYVGRRGRGEKKSFEAFKRDKDEKRKDSFNYPFLTGLTLIALSALLSVIFF